jgi:hypothetical protein
MPRDQFGGSPDTYGTGAIISGTLASRPVPSGANGLVYNATDDNGGTLYLSDGSTWTKITPGRLETGGRELGYAEITTVFSGTSGSTTPQVVTGLSTSVTVASRPIYISFSCTALENSSTGGGIVTIREDTVAIGTSVFTISVAGQKIPGGGRRIRRNPSAGSHTYDITFSCATAAGIPKINASATDPASLQVVEA